MQVQVVSNAGTRALPNVETNVETIRRVDFSKDLFTAAGQRCRFLQLFGCRVDERGDVTVRNDHEVTGGIGESVENDVIEMVSHED